MNFSFALVLVLVALANARVVRHGSYATACFDPNDERKFFSASTRPLLTIPTTALVDPRYRNQVTRAYLQNSLSASNKFWQPIRVSYGDLRVIYDPKVATPNGATDNQMNRYEPAWRNAVSPHVRAGRLTMVFAQLAARGNGVVAGAWYGGVGGFIRGSHSRLMLWMNVNPWRRNRAPWYAERTLHHELGHMMGLFHTFGVQLGCTLNDVISDTSLSVQATGAGCNHRAAHPQCPQDGVRLRDQTNLMSYGRCRGANVLSAGQLARARCAVELNLPWKLQSGNTAPTQPPTRPPTRTTTRTPATRPPSTTLPGVGAACRGGTCIDVARTRCPGANTIAGRCTGPRQVQCCPRIPSPTPPPRAPGVGEACLGPWAGTCFDLQTQRCTGGLVLTGVCRGGWNVQCCPRDLSLPQRAEEIEAQRAEIEEQRPAFSVETNPEDTVEDGDIVVLPDAVYHVGATVGIEVTVALSNPKVYLWETPIITRPGVNDTSSIVANFKQVDDLFYEVELNNVDRGTFVVRIEGEEFDETGSFERKLMTTVFVVDVNSCRIMSQVEPVDFGLERLRSECVDRLGTVDRLGDVDHIISGTGAQEIVCCVPEKVDVDATRMVFANADEMMVEPGTIDTEDNDTVFIQPEQENVFGYWQLGHTSFWGAELTVHVTEAPTEAFDFILVESATETPAAANLPAPLFTVAADQQSTHTFTPAVNSPTVVRLVERTEENGVQMEQFHVVALPCYSEKEAGAGYCYPKGAFAWPAGTNPVGTAFTSDLTCPDGDDAPCAGLALGGQTFSCCLGAASAIQQEAIYRIEDEALEFLPTIEDSASSIVLSTAAALVLVALF